MSIRWTRSDYITLGKAIANFNKKVKELEREENNLNLPELQDYETKRNNIVTRNELNRYIKSLKRFNRTTQQEIVVLENGENITKWEYSELNKARKRIVRNIENELAGLSIPLEEGYSRIQMGSVRARELEAQLKSLDKLFDRQKSDFKQQRESIFRRGTSDYILKKQIVYKDNYLKMIERFSNYKGYNEFLSKIKNLNPAKFFEFIKQNDDLVQFDIYYDVDTGRVVPQGMTNEEMFVSLLETLGIFVE